MANSEPMSEARLAEEATKRIVWERLATLAHKLEQVLDRFDDDGLNELLADDGAFIGQVYRGLPHLRWYAEMQAQRKEGE